MNKLPLRFKPWREVAILGVIVMELSWVVPWFRSLTPATRAVVPWRAFVVLGGLFRPSWLGAD